MISARLSLIAALGLGLAACVGSGSSAPARAPAPSAPTRSTIMVIPAVMAPQGLGGVIGSPPAALLRRFGTPRLDVAEGDARKLQFAGRACVLDIYLYPLAAAAEPTATHVEARLRQGGAPADPAACIREVEGR